MIFTGNSGKLKVPHKKSKNCQTKSVHFYFGKNADLLSHFLVWIVDFLCGNKSGLHFSCVQTSVCAHFLIFKGDGKKMKNTMKRILCTVLVAVMLVTGMPLAYSSAATSISIGDKITLGTYNGEPITWICVDIDDNGPLMLSEDVLCVKEYDAPGTSSTYHTDGWGYIRKNYGSNCWYDSNIRQWLNSFGNVEYTHCPPSYSAESGFLSNFSTNELGCIKTANHIVNVNVWENNRYGYCDGGSSDTIPDLYEKTFNVKNYYYKYVEDKMFLLSASQFNRIYISNKEFLNASRDYLTCIIDGNNSPCFENVCPIDIKTLQVVSYAFRAYEKTGIRPAFYLDVDAYTNSKTHKWFFDRDKTALACSHCNKNYYLSSNKNFKFGKDNFSFEHKDIGSYDISETGMKYVSPALKLDFIALGFNNLLEGFNYIKNKILDNNYGSWGGSCYGIACMNASFLSTVNTTNYGGSSVYDLSLDTKLKDSINIMMYSQASVFSFGNKIGNTFSNKNKDAVSAAKSITQNGYLPVLTYAGHAVNIIGILPDDFDPNYYVLSIYDCNSVNEPKFIIISKDYEKAYLGDFNLDNNDTPIYASSGEIEIISVLTGEVNSIDFWAPGLSTSSSYSRSRNRTVNALNEAASYSLDNEGNFDSDDYIRFLLASDDELTVTADDNSFFVYNNGKITKTNIDDIYYEYLDDFGVTKVVVPCTASSYKIDSNNQYYANVGYDDKISVFYCEKGGMCTFDIDGIASIDTHATESYTELSCYTYDIIADSNAVGILLSNSSSNTKINFSNNNPLIETSDFENMNVKVQYNDEELSVEDIVFATSNNIENFTLKSENKNIVADINYHEHIYSSSVTSAATCTKTGITTYSCACGDSYTVTVPATGHSHGDDGLCINCGEYNEAYDKTLSDSDNCSHLCHKSGFMGFIWMIVRIFIKLFKTNPICECGAAHY